MRFFRWRVWRAIPELDGLDDASARAVVRDALRSGHRRAARWALVTAAVFAAFVVCVVGAGVIDAISRSSPFRAMHGPRASPLCTVVLACGLLGFHAACGWITHRRLTIWAVRRSLASNSLSGSQPSSAPRRPSMWTIQRALVLGGCATMLITAAAGTIVWREMLGGTVDLARRDFRAQRAALIESLQPPAGRDPGASNAFDELARWKIKNDRLKAALAAEWGARDESWPGLSVPLRAGHPARTEENRLHLAALDAAAERYYADAVAAGAMEAADAVAAAPRRSRPARASAWDLEPDALLTKEVRELARLVRIRMIDAAGRRDQAEYRRCCVRIAGLAGAFASQHTVVDRLVAVAALSLAVEGVREDLGTGAIEATLAADCVGDARRAYAAWPSWSVPFQGEAIDVQQLLAERSVYIGTGELALIRSTYEELARAATMARPHRRSILDRLNADIDNAPVRWTRVQLFLPPLHKVLQAKEQIESELSGLEAMAAVERYRADKGVTPPNLAELVPQYLSEVPADAFSDVVKYRRFEARDAMGRDYLVYSAGYDGVDNNGTVGDEWSKALRRGPVGRGLDLPLNRLGEP